MSQPCKGCPWRRSSTSSEIPGFSIERMRSLACTVPTAEDPGDAWRPIMACHNSLPGHDTSCRGYIAVEGHSNLAVRVMAHRGRLPYNAIVDSCRDLDLWPSFAAMLSAYEEALVTSHRCE